MGLMSPGKTARWKLWDRVVVSTGERGRVVCLGGGRALVWHGLGNGEHWYGLGELEPPAPLQQELFDAH